MAQGSWVELELVLGEATKSIARYEQQRVPYTGLAARLQNIFREIIAAPKMELADYNPASRDDMIP